MWATALLVLVVIAVLAYVIAVRQGLVSGPGAATDDDLGGKMSAARRRFVTTYLIVLGIAFIFMEVSLLSIDFPETPRVAEPYLIQGPAPRSESQQGGQSTATAEANTQPSPAPPQSSPTPTPPPVIKFVLPQSTLGNTPSLWLAVYGDNFSPTAKIRLNGHAAAMRYLSSNLVAAQLSPAELLNVGTITIDVIDEANRSSNAIIVPVSKPRVPLNVFFVWKPDINRELQLLLLVCFAGALGSYIHALKSATAYIGNRNMGGSWFWWYMSGPFIGMAMALIFYAVLRGGFLAGTPADEKVVNPFGVVAVGALVGMFADKAALKLGEIFETLFKSGDPRSDKLDAPSISSLDPAKVFAGKAPQTVTIKGKRLGKVTMVRFNSIEVKPDFVSDDEVHFTLTQKDLATPRVLNISVIDPQAGASVSAKLPVVGPKITGPETLPAGTVGSPYQANIVGAEGSTPYQWSIDSPNGLTIDASGRVTGTPPAAGEFPVVVTLKDSDGASVQKTYTLTVT